MKALLGVQSYFSFHWGTASPLDWFQLAKQLGYHYLAVTDMAAVHGMPEVIQAAEETKIAPVFGALFPLLDGSQIIVLVGDAEGYGNLCQCITAWLARWQLKPDPAGGGVPALPLDSAKEVFLGNTTHGLHCLVNSPPVWEMLQKSAAEVLWRIGPRLAAPPAGIPDEAVVCVPGPVFLHPGHFTAHRLLRAIGGATTLDRIPDAEQIAAARPPVLMARPDAVCRSPEEYGQQYAVFSEAMDRADRLAEQLSRFRPCRDVLVPPMPVIDQQGEGEGAGGQVIPSEEPPMERLRRLAYEGAVIRYGTVTAAVQERLEHELALIQRKNFSEYFLVVHDIVARLAGGDSRVRRGRSITCGRGSGAASLVNYCLGVTNVDVIKHDLLFERFLNDARDDPPDIDVDFAWDERDGVLRRVIDTYGEHRVGRVANHNRYDWRGAFRATARAFGYADPEITRHLRNSPSVYAESHPGADSPFPGDPASPVRMGTGRRLKVLRRGGDSDWDRIADHCRLVIDFPHCLSMHCGGVVISSDNLSRSVPVFLSRKGMKTIQWEKDGTEKMGLVKIDLLGNRSLAVIRDAVRAVARDKGIPEGQVIDGDPTDDPATRNLVATGNTFGVFYLESPSMRLLMAKARRGDFRHAVIHSSIIRPAANAFINEYLERVHGKAWTPDDERLAGLFEESYGIPVYQEDVVKMAMALADYDYSSADHIRKCLGKRDAKKRLAKVFPDLANAARRNGVKDSVIRGFWHNLMSMTGYSFCKPHSASYAQVSYEAAYLRAHYPAYFFAAVLSNGGGYYSVQAYVSEAMRLGLEVRGPDINHSGQCWTAEGDGAIRTGLMAISGLSGRAIARIVEARQHGWFTSVDDVVSRTGLDFDDLRQLALTGALDGVETSLNRPQLLWRVGDVAIHNGRRRLPASPSATLFDRESGDALVMDRRAEGLPDLPPYSFQQKIEAEYSVLGFVPGYHPMILYRDEIRRSAVQLRAETNAVFVSAGDIHKYHKKTVTVLAWPIAAKVVETKHGEAMMFQSFEDDRSLLETVIFPEEFKRYHRLLTTVQPLWVTGIVIKEFDVFTLQITCIRSALAETGAKPGKPVDAVYRFSQL